MARRVLIVQTDPGASRTLAEYFQKRSDRVWETPDACDAVDVALRERPDLVLVDLHSRGNDWLELLSCMRQDLPAAKVIVTNRHPDVRRELLAKERGVQVFLREPFTPVWIERALRRLEHHGDTLPVVPVVEKRLPVVRFPMRLKITLPYTLLALLFAGAAVFLVSRYVLESLHERFTSQLINVGQLSGDWVVQEENRLLTTQRLVANTREVGEAARLGDADRLRELVLPLAVNTGEEAVEILGADGISLLSLRRPAGSDAQEIEDAQGDASLGEHAFVQSVLSGKQDALGDKFSGLARLAGGDYFYVAGPLLDGAGNRVGAVLVGKTIQTLVREIRQATMAQVTIYTLAGMPLATTMLGDQEIPALDGSQLERVLVQQDQGSSIRQLQIGSAKYQEISAPWEVRGGEDLGVFGIALAENYITQPSVLTGAQAVGLVLVVFLGVIAMGVYLANQITRPLSQVVRASIEVANGNLEVKVPTRGNDEVMVLATAFNHMITGLQEGNIYRDLLGRSVSPEVREAMRQSFATGGLRLEGQNTTGTVLISDIRSFTSLAENEEPTVILNWLNEYFGELVPVITRHGGVVDKFEGDALLAFFGILPTPLSPEESAYQACSAALDFLEVLESINQRRAERGEPQLITGIGINTGSLTVGGLGTTDRLEYTIIGNTVNTTQRLQGVTQEFSTSGVVISENTLTSLGARRSEFYYEPLGEHAFKGKRELLWVYRLMPLREGWMVRSVV